MNAERQPARGPMVVVEKALGFIEFFGGLAVGFGGCYEAFDHNASMAGFAAVFAMLVGIGLLAIPGWSMMRRGALRWPLQLMPAGMAALLFKAWLES